MNPDTIASGQHRLSKNDSGHPVLAANPITPSNPNVARNGSMRACDEVGGVDPALLLTEQEPMTDVMDAYREFDRREPGWLKVALTAGS
jgi:hypothetical protein